MIENIYKHIFKILNVFFVTVFMNDIYIYNINILGL